VLLYSRSLKARVSQNLQNYVQENKKIVIYSFFCIF
jgi:hypothetical protein